MKPFQKQQTRKKPTASKCEPGCPCKDTGFLYVVNDGQFRTPKGNVIPDKLVMVYCNKEKGEQIRLKSLTIRMPTYSPETMRLPGEPERPLKPKQNELF